MVGHTTKLKCPFCSAIYQGKLAVLNQYSSRKEGQFRPENHKLMELKGGGDIAGVIISVTLLSECSGTSLHITGQ